MIATFKLTSPSPPLLYLGYSHLLITGILHCLTNILFLLPTSHGNHCLATVTTNLTFLNFTSIYSNFFTFCLTPFQQQYNSSQDSLSVHHPAEPAVLVSPHFLDFLRVCLTSHLREYLSSLFLLFLILIPLVISLQITTSNITHIQTLCNVCEDHKPLSELKVYTSKCHVMAACMSNGNLKLGLFQNSQLRVSLALLVIVLAYGHSWLKCLNHCSHLHLIYSSCCQKSPVI